MVEAVVPSPRLPQLAKYEVLEEIGHGGMASVYRARDRRLGREVAVKIIHPHLRNSPEVAARFRVEARAVAKLRHPNIVEVYDVSDADEPEQYLVVELVRGPTLRQLEQKCGTLPPEIAGAIALEVLDALAHAHASGVVHRDVKPENVLIDLPRLDDTSADGSRGGRIVKLADFGIAKLLDAPGVTSTGQVMGSPAHMAPEQIEAGEADARSDLFGLGVVLYECVTGRAPFAGSNPAQVLKRVLDGRYTPAQEEMPRVGARWSRIIDHALAHDKELRFPSAGAMRAAIAAEMERVGVSASTTAAPALREWLLDRQPYETTLARHLVERLCVLGDEARKRGEHLSAAADYNRALSQAPEDAGLLRLVAGYERTERRARMVRRAVVPTVALVLAVTAGLATRSTLRHKQAQGIAERHPPAVATSERLASHPAVATTGTTSAPPGPGPAPSATGAGAPVQRGREAASPKSTDRTLALDLKPPMGVSVSVDGQADRAVTTGDALVVDSGAHSLVFKCQWCVTTPISVSPGERNEALSVSVPIRPATLIVKGSLSSRYQLVGRPEIRISAGTNTVPLKSAYDQAEVQEIETGATAHVRLEAGQTASASFE